MLGVAEIKKMSRTERLRAMELLWESFDSDVDANESPAWHAEVLAERKAEIERGEAKFISLAEAKRRLARKRK